MDEQSNVFQDIMKAVEVTKTLRDVQKMAKDAAMVGFDEHIKKADYYDVSAGELFRNATNRNIAYFIDQILKHSDDPETVYSIFVAYCG